MEKHQQRLEPVDITLTPPSNEELKRVLQLSERKVADLLNTSGEQYRLLNLTNC
jgi:arsenate reductase-like glutaredoxin family protein